MERKGNWKNPNGNKIDSIEKWKGARDYFSNHGYVLIFSLWAIVIFGFIALNFTRNTSIAIKTEITFTERIKNIYAARGACIYATQMLLQKKQERETKSGSSAKFEKTEDPDSSKKDKTSIAWMPSTRPYSLKIGDRNCKVFISDEGAKININKITNETRTSFVKVLTAYKLEELAAEIITDSILDWLDEDELHHVNGAEKQYYDTLLEPYEPKNGPFETIEELTLVRGITPEIFELLREHLTIYGSGKINVNFAPKEVLLYVPMITQEIAEAVVKYRKKKGKIKSVADLEEIFGPYGIIGEELHKTMNLLTIDNSNFVTINSISTFDKVKNSYKLIVQKGADSCSIIAVYPE